MISCRSILAASAALVVAGQAIAQASPPPGALPPQDPYKPPAGDLGDNDRASMLSRDDQIYKATRDAAIDRSAKKKARAVAAKPADIVAGSNVHDSTGALVGTVESVEANGAIVAGAAGRVVVPLDAFGKNREGLLLGVTKAEFDALVANATANPAG